MSQQSFASLQQATLAARKRTNDRTITTRVKCGMFQVVRVTYDHTGKSSVKPCGDWLTIGDAIALLETLDTVGA